MVCHLISCELITNRGNPDLPVLFSCVSVIFFTHAHIYYKKEHAASIIKLMSLKIGQKRATTRTKKLTHKRHVDIHFQNISCL